MVEVTRRGDERIESMLRRFKKQLQRSGVLILAREKMRFERKKSKNLTRKSAIKRSEFRKEREYLRKIGKIDANTFKQ